MTDILKALDAAYEKATNTEELWCKHDHFSGDTAIVAGKNSIVAECFKKTNDDETQDSDALARLFVSLVNHYPELKAEIERLREALKLVEAGVKLRQNCYDRDLQDVIDLSAEEFRDIARTALAQKQGEET